MTLRARARSLVDGGAQGQGYASAASTGQVRLSEQAQVTRRHGQRFRKITKAGRRALPFQEQHRRRQGSMGFKARDRQAQNRPGM